MTGLQGASAELPCHCIHDVSAVPQRLEARRHADDLQRSHHSRSLLLPLTGTLPSPFLRLVTRATSQFILPSYYFIPLLSFRCYILRPLSLRPPFLLHSCHISSVDVIRILLSAITLTDLTLIIASTTIIDLHCHYTLPHSHPFRHYLLNQWCEIIYAHMYYYYLFVLQNHLIHLTTCRTSSVFNGTELKHIHSFLLLPYPTNALCLIRMIPIPWSLLRLSYEIMLSL